MLTHKLWSMAQIGAEWVLYVLLILSVFSIALMIERTYYFFRNRVNLAQVRKIMMAALEQGGPILAIRKLAGFKGAEVQIIREALVFAEGGSAAVEEAAAGEREVQKLKLERGLIFLGTLGNNAPFIGLFGTVLGIINAFRDLASTQLSSAGTKIMSSISEALIATAVGLLLAIPAVIAFNIFQRQVKRVLSQSDTLQHDLLAHLRSKEAATELSFSAPSMISLSQKNQKQADSKNVGGEV